MSLQFFLSASAAFHCFTGLAKSLEGSAYTILTHLIFHIGTLILIEHVSVCITSSSLRQSIGGRRSGEISRTGIVDASLESLESIFYVSDHLIVVSSLSWPLLLGRTTTILQADLDDVDGILPAASTSPAKWHPFSLGASKLHEDCLKC